MWQTNLKKKRKNLQKKWLANLRRWCVVKLLRAVSSVVMVCSNSLQFHFEKYFTKKKFQARRRPSTARRLAQWMETHHTYTQPFIKSNKERIYTARCPKYVWFMDGSIPCAIYLWASTSLVFSPFFICVIHDVRYLICYSNWLYRSIHFLGTRKREIYPTKDNITYIYNASKTARESWPKRYPIHSRLDTCAPSNGNIIAE